MNDNRVSLTRIIAINWYGFRQIFEVNDDILISGAFGTGKSALLDLIQYVMLGKSWKPNRAAAGNANGRDLVGYCLGDTNTLKNGERHFIRGSGVSLIGLEFTFPPEGQHREQRRETWGVRIEYTSPTAQSGQLYFYIPERLDYTWVAKDGKMLDEDAFRQWIARDYGRNCYFNRQQEYLAEMATANHLYFEQQAFRKTFPKAIAFEPEDNVEKFIRDFILEASPLDVRDVRLALQAYDETRERLKRQEDEARYLRVICDQHSRYLDHRRRASVLLHTNTALRLRQAQENVTKRTEELQRKESEHTDEVKELEKACAEQKENERLLTEVRDEIAKDPQQIDFNNLERQKTDLQADLSALREASRSVEERLDARHYRWTAWLKHGSAILLEGLSDHLKVDESLLADLRMGEVGKRMRAMGELAQVFDGIWTETKQLLFPLDRSIHDCQNRLKRLSQELEQLAAGANPGDFTLFRVLRKEFGERVQQLGRLIEVKPESESWWDALELYLNRSRWTIVVDDSDTYRQALQVLRRTPRGRESESLLNPDEVEGLPRRTRSDSLYSKVDVEHPIARHYVEHLLGEVQCVADVEALESSPAARAITPEGVFKQRPLRRQLKVGRSVSRTLGHEGLKRMERDRQREMEENRELLVSLERQRSDIHEWLNQGRKGGLADRTLPDRAHELSQMPKLESKLATLRERIELFRTPELEARFAKLKRLEKDDKDLTGKIAVLNDRNLNYNLTVQPIREALENSNEALREHRLQLEIRRTEFDRDFPGNNSRELEEKAEEFCQEFAKWSERHAAVSTRTAEAETSATTARLERNHERENLENARDDNGNLSHPHYQHDFDSGDEDNTPWEARLKLLESVELEESRRLAEERKGEWERRLQESVLNELNRRLQDAQQTVRLLNQYLNAPVGRFKYRVQQRRDPTHTALWRLLDSGLEPTDPLTAAIQEADIENAKQELRDAVEAAELGDDRARRRLDYRYYHHYDIEQVPVDQPDAPPISIGRSGRNLSGGENQAPFFISMLAAFRRVYALGRSGSNHLGLVVMDEAFSKLSGDGIEDCLGLARNFQLQLVLAFPPERLGVMVPHADTIVICQKQEYRDASGYITRIDNVPVQTTKSAALEALE